MSRKPVHLETAGGKPSPRQRTWQQVRAQSGGFTVTSLADAAQVNRGTVRSYVQCLEAGGFIERIGEMPCAATSFNAVVSGFAHVVFRLVRDVGSEAPRVTRDGQPVTQGLAREQMWRAMKMLGSFTWRDLAISASTETVTVAEDDAKDYCQNLALAGYLSVITKGGGLGKGARPTVYRFVPQRNSGPRPPMVQRMKTVFDPNLGKIVWHPEVDA